MNHNQIIGDYLKQIRKDKGYSLKFVGDRIEKSRYTYRDYETGETEMYWSIFLRVCSVLDVDPMELARRVQSDPRLEKD